MPIAVNVVTVMDFAQVEPCLVAFVNNFIIVIIIRVTWSIKVNIVTQAVRLMTNGSRLPVLANIIESAHG